MCRIASLFLLQRLKWSMSGDALYFNNIETRVVIKFLFFLQGKTPKEIHSILTETLGEHASSYSTVKNWVARCKSGDFSTCVAPRPGRPKIVTTFFRKSSRLWDNVEKYCTARQARNYNIKWWIRVACWTPTTTNTHSEYVTHFFLRQQWLRKRDSMLRCTQISRPVCHQRYNGRQRLNRFDSLSG